MASGCGRTSLRSRMGLSLLLTVSVALPAAGSIAAQNLGGLRNARATGNAHTYSDPRGDAIAGGMDITTVALSNDSTKLRFAVRIPSSSTLPARKGVGIFFDTDRNANTGSAGGAEYRVFVEPNSPTRLEKLDGKDWVSFGESVLSPYYDRGTWAGGIRLKSLGSVSTFKVFALTYDRLGSGGSSVNDRAPNSGSWTYSVRSRPKKPSWRLLIASLERRPSPPVAGQRLAIDAVVWRLPVGSGHFSGRVDCSATLAGKDLRSVGESIESDRAVCEWDIPASAGGRTVSVVMVVTEGAATATKRVQARVSAPQPTISIAEIKTDPSSGPRGGLVFYYGMKIGIVTASGAERKVTAGDVDCRATVAGRPLEVILHEIRPEYAAVQCGWSKVPKNASGKTMTGSLVLRSERPVRLTFTHNFKFIVD